jgi:hypothetical protein
MTGPIAGARAGQVTRPWQAGLLAAYPASWRARYGEELEQLVADLRADGRRGALMAFDLLRGAAAAWLTGKKGFAMSERSRNALYTVLWSWVVFAAIAALFGHDLGVYPSPVVATQIAVGTPAVPSAYYTLVAAGVVGVAATAFAAVAFAIGVARDARARGRKNIYLLMAVPPVVAAVWLGGVQVLRHSGPPGPDGLVLLWALLGVAGIAVSTQVVIHLTRTSELTELTWRIGTVMAVVVTAAMVVAAGATIAWGLLLRTVQLHIVPASGWLAVSVIMCVMAARAILALIRLRQDARPEATGSPVAA